MAYLMKQRMFSWGDDYYIKDQNNNNVYFVDGKALSFGDKLSLQDMNKNELAYIEQKVFSYKKRYKIYRSGMLFAEIVNDRSFIKDKYTIDIPGPNDYEVKGNLFNYEYSFTRKDREVAHVSKKFFSFPDTYGIEIVDGEDDITIIATVVVIDLVNQKQKRSAVPTIG